MAGSSITPQFNVAQTVYYVQSSAIISGSIQKIVIIKSVSETSIKYDFGNANLIEESNIGSTPEEAVENFSAKLLDEFE